MSDRLSDTTLREYAEHGVRQPGGFAAAHEEVRAMAAELLVLRAARLAEAEANIERVARALYGADMVPYWQHFGEGRWLPWDTWPEGIPKQEYRRKARAALAAMREGEGT